MLFSMNSQVRFSEVDNNERLRLDSIVNYFQDCTMFHSESVGAGAKKLREAGYFWLLSSWQINIHRIPVLYEKINVITNPYDFKGFFGNRNFRIEDEKGTSLVDANSVWVFLDIASLKPAKILESEISAYKPFAQKSDMEYASRKIKLPEKFISCPPIDIRVDQLDTNQHVNNCQYIKTAMEVLGLRTIPSQIRAEYKKSAVLGDVFYPGIAVVDNKQYVDLCDKEGLSYASVEFTV